MKSFFFFLDGCDLISGETTQKKEPNVFQNQFKSASDHMHVELMAFKAATYSSGGGVRGSGC